MKKQNAMLAVASAFSSSKLTTEQSKSTTSGKRRHKRISDDLSRDESGDEDGSVDSDGYESECSSENGGFNYRELTSREMAALCDSIIAKRGKSFFDPENNVRGVVEDIVMETSTKTMCFKYYDSTNNDEDIAGEFGYFTVTSIDGVEWYTAAASSSSSSSHLKSSSSSNSSSTKAVSSLSASSLLVATTTKKIKHSWDIITVPNTTVYEQAVVILNNRLRSRNTNI